MFDFIAIPDTLGLLSFWGLIFISCFTSMLTASLGIGGGILMLATMAQLIPVKAIVPIHGMVQLGSNTGRAAIMSRDIHWTTVCWFALGSVIGAFLGGQTASNLPIDWLRALLGLFILFTVLGPSTVTKLASDKTLLIGGAVSTFLTMFIGATGPFVLAVIRAFKFQRIRLVATSAACLVIQHALKVLMFGALGFTFAPYAPLIALMILSGFVGTVIGRRLLIKLNERLFQRWLNIVLSVLALRLIWIATF